MPPGVALERNSMSIRPLRDGERPFYDDPSDIAVHAENALRNIAAGQPYITDVTLRYLEEEAIARFAKQTQFRPTYEPDKNKDRDLWCAKWANEASHAQVNMEGLNPVAQASVRVLLGACELRNAIQENGSPQKIAALSMLLVCEVLMGGYSLEYHATLETKNALKNAKDSAYKKGFGQEQDDMNKARLACIDGAAKRWKENPSILIGTMANALEAGLLQNIEKLPSLDTVPKAKTIKAWLREAAKVGKLSIPDAAQRRGRPPKPRG